VTLLGLSWEENGRDVVLRVLLPGANASADRERLIVLRWASDLAVKLEGGGGPPLTWETRFEREATGRWAVVFDFASAGELQLSCAEIEVIKPA
jgi:hypothetical protein